MSVDERMVHDIVQKVVANMQITGEVSDMRGVFKDMNDAINASIESNVDTTGISQQISTPYNSYSSDKYQLPMRSTFGLAYQFSTKGLLSVEYDYLHHFRHD